VKKCFKNLNTEKRIEINQVCIETKIENKTLFNKIITSINVPLEFLLRLNHERFSNEVIRKNFTGVLIMEAKRVDTCINWIRMNSISRITYLQRGTRLRTGTSSQKNMSI
jgi:hypothetical protein